MINIPVSALNSVLFLLIFYKLLGTLGYVFHVYVYLFIFYRLQSSIFNTRPNS